MALCPRSKASWWQGCTRQRLDVVESDESVFGAVALGVVRLPAARVAHPGIGAVQVSALDALLVSLFSANTAYFSPLFGDVRIHCSTIRLGLTVGCLGCDVHGERVAGEAMVARMARVAQPHVASRLFTGANNVGAHES